MILKHVFKFAFLLHLTLYVSGEKHKIRAENNEETLKFLREIENELHLENKNTGHEKVARNVNNNCPPETGILQVAGGTDLYKANSKANPLNNLFYMCGMTSIMYDAPVGWELRDGPGGHKLNVTIYGKKKKDVPLCCPGYIRDEDDICVPECKGRCSNGLCVRPGSCVCYEGYTLNSLGECVVTCPCGCPQGQCAGDKCTCNAGYALDENGKTCSAVCNFGCKNGDCTSPNNCTCHQGYRKHSEQSHVCTPHCHQECKNGNCTGPDVCTCFEGYYKQKNTGKCTPRCHGCDHGTCIKPYNCVCHKGYKMVDGICKPVCERDCINSTCTSPGVCTCFAGYQKENPSVCVPRCFPSCRNAVCVAPNRCECKEGYVKKSHSLNNHECVTMVREIANAVGNLLQSIRH